MANWMKWTIGAIAVLAIVAAGWLIGSRLIHPAKPSAGSGSSIADTVYKAVDPKVGEVATATVSAGNTDAVNTYLEARIISAASSKPEWALAAWGPDKKRTGVERLDAMDYAKKEASQRWAIFHFSDGSTLRIAEDPAPAGGNLNAWKVKAVEVSRP
jgi:hypothetical protein